MHLVCILVVGHGIPGGGNTRELVGMGASGEILRSFRHISGKSPENHRVGPGMKSGIVKETFNII